MEKLVGIVFVCGSMLVLALPYVQTLPRIKMLASEWNTQMHPGEDTYEQYLQLLTDKDEDVLFATVDFYHGVNAKRCNLNLPVNVPWTYEAYEEQILETLEENEGQHLTVEELHARVNAYLPEIGLATVYRTIQLFLEMGLADRIDLNDGQVRYEIADAGDDRRHHRHHHLICVKCGRVWAFEGDLLEELESRLMTELSFQVINHEVKLFGYCQECRNI